MQRITRAILEVESIRNDMPLLMPSDIAGFALLNTALVALHQFETLLAHRASRHDKINAPVDRVAEIIRQVNEEIMTAPK